MRLRIFSQNPETDASRIVPAIARCLSVFSRPEKTQFVWNIAVQFLLSLVDLVGVALIGLLGALSVSGIQSQEPSTRVGSILEKLQLEGLSFQAQTAAVGILAALLLTSRTVVSIILTKRMLIFLSQRATLLSHSLISRMFTLTNQQLRSFDPQKLLFATTQGVTKITLGVFGAGMTAISDFMTLFIMFFALLLVDWKIALVVIFIFGLVSAFFYLALHKKVSRLGNTEAKFQVDSNVKILESISLYRELTLRSTQQKQAKEINEIRSKLADVLAETSFLPNVSKFGVEGLVIISALGLGAFTFAVYDATKAIGMLSIFLAAGMRIAPAIIRMQQSLITVKSSVASASPTIELINFLDKYSKSASQDVQIDLQHNDFIAEIEVRDLEFAYEGSQTFKLQRISLQVNQGSSLAVIGPSGSGKSTFIELLLGGLTPTHGSITISGLSPDMAAHRFPGAIGYVPQDVVLVNGTLRENLLLGVEGGVYPDSWLLDCLRTSQLDLGTQDFPMDLNLKLGKGSVSLSGGQKQRLGIARALVTNPKVLVLDEATSALDSKIESELSDALANLKGSVTLVVIAHRLSTIQHLDKVIYFENGSLRGWDTFANLRAAIPQLEEQANLLGI